MVALVHDIIDHSFSSQALNHSHIYTASDFSLTTANHADIV